MFEIKGKYNTAKIFTDIVEQQTIAQICTLLNQESVAGSTIRIMPDCHAGAGCVVGTTMTITDRVIPNLVGVDIGCGMLAVRLREKDFDLAWFDQIVHQYIPAGGDVWKIPLTENQELQYLACNGKNSRLKIPLANCSLCTLGGGNHFIELDRSATGDVWLVIHTGSRHIGREVCDFYQKEAFKELTFLTNCGNIQTKRAELAEFYRKAGRQREIPQALEEFTRNYQEQEPEVPAELAYCTGRLLENYLHDMGIVQRHARKNRRMIADQILRKTGFHEEESFDTIHNYIDLDAKILRKGSISAKKRERVLIPLNMRDGSIIAVGKGNPDWNESSPHGAGRLYSRSAARENIRLEDYQATMAGIYSSSVGVGTIDECPMAYKPMESIVEAIRETVDILEIIKPIYNFKAGARIE